MVAWFELIIGGLIGFVIGKYYKIFKLFGEFLDERNKK
jgi:hypothetical protein